MSTYLTNTTVPEACQRSVNTGTDAPYTMSCTTGRYTSSPYNNSVPIFQSCCGTNRVEAFGHVAFGGDCYLYCNATTRENEAQIASCLDKYTGNITGYQCEGTRNEKDGKVTYSAGALRVESRKNIVWAVGMLGLVASQFLLA